MTEFSRIKKLLSGSTTMPMGTKMGGAPSHVHYHDGVPCTHDHSHDHGHDNHDHADHNHHADGTCCDNNDCAHEEHKK